MTAQASHAGDDFDSSGHLESIEIEREEIGVATAWDFRALLGVWGIQQSEKLEWQPGANEIAMQQIVSALVGVSNNLRCCDNGTDTGINHQALILIRTHAPRIPATNKGDRKENQACRGEGTKRPNKLWLAAEHFGGRASIGVFGF